jgi:hypothetical protein
MVPVQDTFVPLEFVATGAGEARRNRRGLAREQSPGLFRLAGGRSALSPATALLVATPGTVRGAGMCARRLWQSASELGNPASVSARTHDDRRLEACYPNWTTTL